MPPYYPLLQVQDHDGMPRSKDVCKELCERLKNVAGHSNRKSMQTTGPRSAYSSIWAELFHAGGRGGVWYQMTLGKVSL